MCSIDSLQDQGIPAYVNAINMPAIELPFVSNFISEKSRDTLDYDLSGTEENMILKIFIRGKTKDTLTLTGAIGFELYQEGDVNGDGATDIGFLPAYSTSACRNYEILTFTKNKIKTLFDIKCANWIDTEGSVFNFAFYGKFIYFKINFIKYGFNIPN
jgi:hypothetical protein